MIGRVTRRGLLAAPLFLLACSQADPGSKPASPADAGNANPASTSAPLASTDAPAPEGAETTAAPASSDTAADSAAIRQTLLAANPDYARYMRESSDAQPDRYVAFHVDLNGDGNDEVLVYLMGPWSCGTGGCTLILLVPTDTSYRLMNTFPITRTPVLLGPGKSQGWLDIIRHEAGGGAPSRDVVEAFDGKGYAKKKVLTGAAPGDSVVAFPEDLSFEQGEPLLPAD